MLVPLQNGSISGLCAIVPSPLLGWHDGTKDCPRAAVEAGTMKNPRRSVSERDSPRLSPAECQEVLRRAFNAVLVESDVFLVIEGDPARWRRFKSTEEAVDAAARSGPTLEQFEAVVGLHIAVIRAAAAAMGPVRPAGDAGDDRRVLARFGNGQRPDEMPELPDDTVAAVGFSFGDGRPGQWAGRVVDVSVAKSEGEK
jgi:hypothetical protein